MPPQNPTKPDAEAPGTVAECPDRDSSVRDSLLAWQKLPAISGLQCVQALGRAGFAVDAHRAGFVELVREGRWIEVPVPLSKQLGRDVLVAILKRASIGPTSFVALLNEGDDLGRR